MEFRSTLRYKAPRIVSIYLNFRQTQKDETASFYSVIAKTRQTVYFCVCRTDGSLISFA